MTNYTYQLTKRGLCSELNSLLGFYESVMHEDCQVFIDASRSQYFKKVSIYDVFTFPDLFVRNLVDGSQIVSSNQWRKAAKRRYKPSIDKKTCSNFFSYTDNFQSKLNSKINKLSLNEQYNCLFIRRGDKVGEGYCRWTEKTGKAEAKRLEFEEYFNRINNSIKTVFVFTDDYRCVMDGQEYIESNNLNYRIVALTEPYELGWCQDVDIDTNRIHTEEELVRFLSKIEVAKNARQFIGTETSNIYRYLRYQCVNDTNFISLD